MYLHNIYWSYLYITAKQSSLPSNIPIPSLSHLHVFLLLFFYINQLLSSGISNRKHTDAALSTEAWGNYQQLLPHKYKDPASLNSHQMPISLVIMVESLSHPWCNFA